MHGKQIAIIGAGILGLATAYHLLQHGYDVLILEQHTIGHQKGGSHGSSRLLRYEYKGDQFYPTLVDRGLRYWKHLEEQTGQTLYQPTGILVLRKESDDATRANYETLQNLGYSINYLTRKQCLERFPQFNPEGYTTFTYNENAGMLRALYGLETLRRSILAQGGNIREGQKVVRIINENHAQPLRLLMADQTEITADRLVVAPGPWIHHLLGDYHLPVRITRQYVLYFGNLAEKDFDVSAFPAFMIDSLYGFPLDPWSTGQERWLKAADHKFGNEIEADEQGPIDMQTVARVREKLAQVIPALRTATLTSIDSCIYDVSKDEDFILDYLPTDKRIVFAAGMSGHAFKFGLILGEMLSNLVREAESTIPMERFRLARFHPDQT